MKTSFDLPEPLLRRAKALAAEQGRPLRDLVAEALAEKLKVQGSTVAGRNVPVGRREGRRETWEEWKSHLDHQPDGILLNTYGIDAPEFFAYIDSLRREPQLRRNPFEDGK